jgi:hypothetical protein
MCKMAKEKSYALFEKCKMAQNVSKGEIKG